MIMNIQYSEKIINSSKFIKIFCEISCTHYDTNHIAWVKALENQVLGDIKGH